MNTTLQLTQTVKRTLIVDAVLLTVACLIPTLSHLTALPLYQLNPMLIVVLASMVLVGNRKNALLMAVLVPAISSLVVGMPMMSKALLMGAEFIAVVATFSLLERKLPVWLAMLSAVLCGKVLFYALKAIVLTPTVLIGTSVAMQLCAVAVAVVLFAVCYKRR